MSAPADNNYRNENAAAAAISSTASTHSLSAPPPPITAVLVPPKHQHQPEAAIPQEIQIHIKPNHVPYAQLVFDHTQNTVMAVMVGKRMKTNLISGGDDQAPTLIKNSSSLSSSTVDDDDRGNYKDDGDTTTFHKDQRGRNQWRNSRAGGSSSSMDEDGPETIVWMDSASFWDCESGHSDLHLALLLNEAVVLSSTYDDSCSKSSSGCKSLLCPIAYLSKTPTSITATKAYGPLSRTRLPIGLKTGKNDKDINQRGTEKVINKDVGYSLLHE